MLIANIFVNFARTAFETALEKDIAGQLPLFVWLAG
jgi:hypothetical protein